jgi:3-deoxy-D-manno-octulosonate 8-phosphate phosphatase (KDO 8-P phosphatase)
VNDLDLRAAKIRLLCTDIDGVLTTGALHYGTEPGHTKAFHVRDGAAIKWLQRAGIPVAFISGLESTATLNRARDLGDDLPDLPLLRRVGLACCPSDAVDEVKAACHWVAPIPGGHGLLRVVAERILKAQGLWGDMVSNYEV